MAFRKPIKFKNGLNTIEPSTFGNLFVTGGNIGINNTAPSYLLDVNGDINLTGEFYQNGSLFTTSQWTGSIGSTISYTSGVTIMSNASIGNSTITNLNLTDLSGENIKTSNITTTNIVFTSATASNISVGNVVSSNLTTATALITDLSTTNLVFTSVTASNISVGNVVSSNLTTATALITDLSTTNLVFTSVTASNISVGNVVSSNLTTATALITDLSTTNLVFTSVTASNISVGNVVSSNLTTATALITDLSTTNLVFTSVTASNISVGNVVSSNLTTATALITDLSTTNLVFTSVTASNISVGNVVSSNLTTATALITDLSTTNLVFTSVTASNISVGNVVSSNLTTATALITDLSTTNLVFTSVTASNISVGNVVSSNLTTATALITDLSTTNLVFTSVTASNISVGNVVSSNLTTATALITDLSTTNLVFTSVTASNISVGNVVSSNLTTATALITDLSTTNLVFTSVTASNISVGNVVSSNLTTATALITDLSTTNLVFTSVTASNISVGNVVSSNLTTATALITDLSTTNLVFTSVTASNISVGNVVSSNLTTATALITDLSSTNLVTTYVSTANISVGNLFSSSLTSSSILTTDLSATSLLVTNITATNITVLNLQAVNETVTNLTVVNESIQNLIVSNDITVSDNLIAFGNSNTVGNIFTTGGNVGIGNTSPSYDLDVTGDINFSGDFYKNGSLFTTSQWTGSIGSLISYTSGNVIISNASVGNLTVTNSLVTDSTITNLNVPTITATNLVATNETVSSLFATGASVTNLAFTTISGASSTATIGNIISNDISVSDNLIALGNSNTVGNIFTTGGNVGIGNTAPSYDLDVTGDINFTGDLYKNGSLFGGGGSSQWTGSVGSLISYTSGTVLISNASVESITIANGIVTGDLTITGNSLKAISNSNTVGAIFTTGGNVGIGTTSPSVKLDVAGGLRITGGSLIASSNTNTIGSLFTTFVTSSSLVPVESGLFAYYNGSSWTGSQWTDLTTNGNHATTVGGTINTTTENSITYIYGDTSSNIRFPAAVLPSTYTFFHVTKYNGGSRARIFDGISNNWLSGFWNAYSGVAYHTNWVGPDPPSSYIQNSTNWVLSSDQKGLYKANGTLIGTIGNGQSTHLSIQDGQNGGENSDWAISEIIVYNRELTTSEIEQMESWLMDKYSAFTFTTSLTYSSTYTTGTVTLSTTASFVVGIGNTSPSYLLDVNGDLNFSGDLYQNGSLFNVPSVWTGSIGSSVSYTGGNVGIGTATPQHTLDIQKQNVKVGIRAREENETATLYLGTPHIAGDVFKSAIIAQGVGGWSRNYLHFCLNDNSNSNDATQNASLAHSRMTITYDGNVGIANVSPSYKLDVTGNINFTGDLYKNGSIFSGGGSSQWTGSVGNTISYTSGNVIANMLTIETSGNIIANKLAIQTSGNIGIATSTTSTNYIFFGVTGGGTSLNTQPNIALTSASDGGYVVTASTDAFGDAGWQRWKAFNKNTSEDSGWHTDGGLYSVNYNGSVSTTLANTTVYSGEWIQLQLPSSSVVTSMKITPRFGGAGRAPRDFILVGSTSGNNSSWVTLYSDTDETWGNDGAASAKTFTMTTTGSYNYYRLIINKNQSDDSVNITEIEFYTTELISLTYQNTYLGKRIYSGTRGSELLLFKGNDYETTEIDRIRLLSTEHRFDTASVYGTFEQVATSGTTRMIIASSGNVGIGNTTPSYTVDVTGDVNFTGNLYQNGTLFSGAGSPVYITRSAQTTGAQTISSGSNVLLFPDAGQTSGNIVYNTTGTFTVSDTGLYSVYVDVDVYNADDIVDLYILKNNTEDTINGRIAWRNISLDDAASINALVYLEQNDYVTVIVNNTSANSFVTPYAGSKVNSFGMSLLNSSSGVGSGSQWTGSIGNPISYTSGTTIMSNASISNITIANGIVTGDLTITGNSLKAISNSNTVGAIFTTGGNVGIGTTSPSVKLDVAGGLRITGGSLIASSNTNTIGSLFTTFVTSATSLVPVESGLFAYYNGSSWTGSQWTDLTTNGNHATTVGGTINTTIENSITYIYGNTSSSMRFPEAVLPNTYTFFHVAKYNGSSRARIFDGVTNNWLSGFHSNKSGIAFHAVDWIGPQPPASYIQNSTNWVLSSDQSQLYRANGLVVGTGAGFSTHLSVQDGTHTFENSDWAISEVIVYNRELTTSEIEQMESWLMDKYSAFTFTTSLTYSSTYTTGTVTLSTTANFLVGIGNTAPSYLLDINGDINFTGDIYQNGSLFSGGSGGSSSQWTGSVGSTISYTSGTTLMTNTSIQNMTAINLLVTNLTVGSIRNVNEIAVGLELNGFTVPTPLAPLDIVQKPSKNNAVAAFQFNGGGYRHWIVSRHNTGSNNGNGIDFYLNTGTGDSDSSTPGTNNQQVMTIAGLGVGIGLLSPNAKLDVAGTFQVSSGNGVMLFNNSGSLDIKKNGEVTFNLENTTAPAQTKIYSYVDTRTYFQTYGDLLFTGIDTVQLRGLCIRTSGNVGIGTTSPSQLLTVNGDITAGGLSATNVTTTSLIATNITATNITVLNLQAINETVTNLTVVNESIQNLIVSNDVSISDNLIAVGNSNTLGSLFTTGGNVGIGTTTPNAKLDVTGTFEVSAGSGYMFFNTDGNLGLNTTIPSFALEVRRTYTNSVSHPEEFPSSIALLTNHTNTAGPYGCIIRCRVPVNQTVNQSDLQFLTPANDGTPLVRMTINGSSNQDGGKVGIGTSSPTYQLQLSTDNAGKPNGGSWANSSDQRLKENIQLADLNVCYDIVKNLPLKRYRWKDNTYTDEQIKDRNVIGWIAQDVSTVFPKAVEEKPFSLLDGTTIEDCLSLNETMIMRSLYGAVQQLIKNYETKTEELDNQLQNEKQKNILLEQKLNDLEQRIQLLE